MCEQWNALSFTISHKCNETLFVEEKKYKKKFTAIIDKVFNINYFLKKCSKKKTLKIIELCSIL